MEELMVLNHLKVLNIVPEDRFSGSIKRITQVGRMLKKQCGIQTLLVMPEGEGDGDKVAQSAGLESRRVRLAKTPRPSDIPMLMAWVLRFPLDLLRLFCLIRKEKPDLVHVNSAFFIAPVLAAQACRIPIVWHLNDTMLPRNVAYILGIVVKRLSTRVAATSAPVGRHYGLSEQYFSVLQLPVDLSEFCPRQVNPRGPRISIVANWSRVKGIEYFLKAVKGVAQAHPEAEFHLAGAELSTQPDYAVKIKRLLDTPELKERVMHHGFITDVPGFLAGMDIHVMSSINESGPFTVLEGMAASLPLVATDVGSVRSYLEPKGMEKGGIVTPPADVSSLTQAINWLIENPQDAETMGKAGRKTVEQLFSLEKAAQAHFELYMGLTHKFVH